jgi:hypothetical protein
VSSISCGRAEDAAEQALTLARAPLERVGTVDEQDQQYERWPHSRRANG